MKYIITLCLLACGLSVPAQSWFPDSLFADQATLIASPGNNDELNTLLIQPNGLIIAGGYDYDITFNDFHNNMVRFDVCGTLDSTFGTNGIVHHKFSQRNVGHAYALQADGKILAAGIQAGSNAGSGQIPFVARYNVDGSPDTTFGMGGTHTLRFDILSHGAFYSVTQMPDGRILCGGVSSANNGGGTDGFGAMRFMADGSLDPSFDGDGKARKPFGTSSQPARAMILQNGNIVLAGRYRVGFTDTYFAATCFDSTGAIVNSFGNAGIFTDTVKVTYGGATCTAIQADEHILLAGLRDPASTGVEVIRITPSGTLDPSFGADGHVNLPVASFYCYGLRVDTAGKIQVMGRLGSQGYIVQLDASGAVDTTFGANGVLTLNAGGSPYVAALADLPNNRLLAAGATNNMILMRYSTVSHVPQITGDASGLQVSGTGPYQWYVDSMAIPGATGATIVPMVNGNYTVSVMDDLGCEYLSAAFPVLNVGLGQKENPEGIRVYPNPVADIVTIRFGDRPATADLRVIDLQGRTILRLPAVMDGETVSVAAWPAGTYFMEFTTERGVAVSRLVRR